MLKKITLFLIGFFVYSQEPINNLSLIPWPKNININSGKFVISKNLKLDIKGIKSERLDKYSLNFLRRLDQRTGVFLEQQNLKNINNPSIIINVKKIGDYSIYEDETYFLNINNQQIIIDAKTDIGAFRALETLLQLVQNDSQNFYFPNLKIEDSPRFKWRGLMIDSSRHFMPLDVIKRNLDAMAAMKMNIFHWHLTDDQGWRVEIKKHPKLTDLASDRLFYTQIQIKEIVAYAKEKGIIVIPEIDVPGHASSILTAYPELGSDPNANYSLIRNAGIFDPTLDPTNPKTYKILQDIFLEMFPLFETEYFHIGGDENEGKEWDKNQKIQDFKKKNNLKTNHDLQTYFNMKLLPFFKKHNKKIMGWDEIMTENMDKQAIIHSWRGTNEGLKPGESLVNTVKAGFKTVLSNGFYLDLVLPMETYYNNKSLNATNQLNDNQKDMILGGEATMWAELVTPLTIDSRIWPRTCAIAERLWSDEKITDINSFRKRLENVSFRLEELGITHLKNKDVILRNISNNQDIKAVKDFSELCEPLKNYTRNKGGIEYSTFSPFTLFADACTPDAKQSLEFDVLVQKYIKNKSDENKNELIKTFNFWLKTNQELNNLSQNAPLINTFLPLSNQLKITSEKLISYLNKENKFSKEDILKEIEKCNSKDFADVELSVYKSLKEIIND